MKLLHILSAAGLVASLPTAIDEALKIVAESNNTDAALIPDVQVQSVIRSEFVDAFVSGDNNSCPEAIFFFARGTLELGNMGTAVGPILAAALEAAVPSIWVQGVDFYYSADPADNSLPRGTNEVSIQSLVAVLNAAAEFCPDADIVAAGFNQGTAVIAGAVGDAPATLRDRIVGVALFGYTLNPPSENNGQIPNYPPAQTTVFCPFLDFVCWIPSWTVSPAIYGFDALTGAAFLASRINTP